MYPKCGVGFAAVCAKAVRAGIMASSSGSARAVPTPRRTVRRVKCFLVMNIWMLLFCFASLLLRGHLRGGRWLNGFYHTRLERRRGNNSHHNRRELVIVVLSVLHNLPDAGHVEILDPSAQRIRHQFLRERLHELLGVLQERIAQ